MSLKSATPADVPSRRKALRDWMRGQRLEREFGLPLRSYYEVRQLRAASANINASGGYLQQPTFEDALEIALLQYDAFRPFGTVDRVETGGATHHPTVNDTNQIGVIVPENMQPGTNDIVQFGDAVFRPQKFSSQFLLLPSGLVEDSGIDVDLWLGRIIGQRIGRIQTKTWTAGVLIPQATQGAAAASHTAIGFSDLMTLEYAVDPAYRQSPACAWMCNNTIRQGLAQLVGTAGNPIFLPRRTPEERDMLDGFPILYNPYLPSALAAGSQCLFFGDWSRVHIRDVKETRLVRLEERFADYDQVAICGLLRSDMLILDAGTHPIQFLMQ